MAALRPLHRRMIEHMTIRNLSHVMPRSYIHAVARFSDYFGRSLDRPAPDDARACHLRVSSKGVAAWDRTNFDGLVNNAGCGLFNPIVKLTEEEFDGLFAVHLKGPFFPTQALHAIRRMAATS